MTTSLETAFEAIKQLSDKFSAHSAAFTSPEFSEASLRQEFLDDFLTALGWDVAGRKHPNPFEREVRVERSVAVGLGKKRADYALYVKPNFRDVRLFIEAKKPGVALATQDNYFQTARYGWSSNTPLAVLTNFRELHVIDCRYRPDIDTVLEIGATSFKYTYTDLNDFEKFSEIYWLMSREAVVDGSLQKISEALPKKRGKGVQKGAIKGGFQSIDDAFLEDLDVMRDELARSLKNRNNQLDGSTLTEVTQRVLDRLVFLRFLEDKLIETQERVADFGSTGSAWTDFVNARPRLKLRREAANGKIAWFELNWPRRKKLFEEHKILIRQTAPRIMAAMDTEGWYCLKSGLVVQLPEGSGIDYPYLLGVLNSKLIGYFYNELVGEQGRVFPEVKPVQLFKLPIKVPDSKNKNEMELAAKLRVVVTQMCDASQKKAGAMTERDLKFFEAKCAQLERQIDALVYQIYGVSKADIDAVEQAMPA